MLQVQARALGDPTRYEIFRRLADSGESMDVSALTDEFELNHNGIRQHLSKLVEAGLVIEYQARAKGRGRPRLLYRVDPSADSRWGHTGPYEQLSLLLAEVLRTGDPPEEVGRRAGRAEIASRLENHEGADAVDVLLIEMARQGFDPHLEIHGESVDAHILNCPYASAAAADPDIVCSLHVGMVKGIVEGIDGFVLDEFERAEPMSGRCCVHGRLTTDDGKGGKGKDTDDPSAR